jgi:integrase
MSVTRLPSGRWRAQVYDQRTGKNVSVSKVLGGPGTFRTKTEAKDARSRARARLGQRPSGTTLAEFADRWVSDPLFARPKESTNLHNAERIRAFVKKYGALPIDLINDEIAAEWLRGGKRNGSVPALRAMFNDASAAKAGRLISVNPFANLGIARTAGNRHRQPPSEKQMLRLIEHAQKLTPPSFAAYLEFGCLTAARPGELDALKWSAIRFDEGEIDITVQWNVKARKFTLPKYGPYTIALVKRAREVLDGMKRDDVDSPFVFITLRGHHYTPSTRTHHWNRVRAAAGLGKMTLYLATRHYFGWYAVNVLELPPHIVAEQLGHKDGGELVVQLYGHPDARLARRRIREAHDAAGREDAPAGQESAAEQESKPDDRDAA